MRARTTICLFHNQSDVTIGLVYILNNQSDVTIDLVYIVKARSYNNRCVS